jgi:hypothetical protein
MGTREIDNQPQAPEPDISLPHGKANAMDNLRSVQESGAVLAANTLLAESVEIRQGEIQLAAAGPRRSACEIAAREYNNPSSSIFKVNSGEFKGYKVPEALRCAIFQSNVAKEAGIISASDVTIRAVDFGQMIQGKGYRAENFSLTRNYPNGTYLVGVGANDGTNSRHVAMVCDGKLIHTKNGQIVNEPISNKFFAGAYDKVTAYIPPARRSATAYLDAGMHDPLKI